MKKIRIISSLILGIVFSSYGQTNKIENTGNVGIGTTTPTVELEVKSVANNNAEIHLNSSTDGKPSVMRFQDAGESSWGFISNYPTAGKFSLYNYNTNSNALVLNPNGNVGIGTTNPQEKFQIGNTYAFHDGGHKVIGFLYKPSGGLDLDPSLYSSEIRFDPTNGNFHLGTSSTITEGPIARLSINKIGNIGIGTTSPSAKLEIKGAGDGVEILKLSTERPWVFKQEGTGASSNLVLQEISGNKFFKIKSYDNTDIYTIQSNSGNTYFKGDMGIGTNDTKGYKLGVKGKIAAEEVKVALYNTWPDYVFEDDYNLPTLQQVENHITEKGHLENIPSAIEVAENGIQLGEMNAKLLQKIEELTLYMIEQNKKTDNLIKEVKALKQKNAELEQKMK